MSQHTCVSEGNATWSPNAVTNRELFGCVAGELGMLYNSWIQLGDTARGLQSVLISRLDRIRVKALRGDARVGEPDLMDACTGGIKLDTH